MDLDQLITFSEQKLEIIQKIRLGLAPQKDSPSAGQSQQPDSIRKTLRKELRKLVRQREDFSKENLKFKTELINSLSEKTVFKYPTSFENFVPMKTKPHKVGSASEISSHVYLVNDSLDPTTVKLLDVAGTAHATVENFVLSSKWDELGSTGFQQKEGSITTTMTVFIDQNFVRKELNIIMKERPDAGQRKSSELGTHDSHILKFGHEQIPVRAMTNFTTTDQAQADAISSTDILGGNGKGFFMLVSDDTGHIHKYSQMNISKKSTALCEDDRVNHLLSRGESLYFFCDYSIGRYVPELNRFKLIHEQRESKIYDVAKFDSLFVAITGVDSLHYFNQSEQGSTPGKNATPAAGAQGLQTSLRSIKLPFRLTNFSKDLKDIKIQQFGSYLIVYNRANKRQTS